MVQAVDEGSDGPLLLSVEPMLFGLVSLLVLSGWLLDLRRRPGGAAWAGPIPGRWGLCLALAVAMSAPLWLALPTLLRSDALVPSDASTHAAVAAAMAREGLPHGWVETFNGGFPVALHYPVVGWLLVAGLVRAGLPIVSAFQSVAIGCLLLAPVVAVAAAWRRGASPAAALGGGAMIAWLSPHNAFVGGWETALTRGLLSQVISWPASLLLVGAVVSEGPAWAPVLAGALLFAVHPQVGVGVLLVLLPAVIASWDRAAALRFGRALLGACVLGVAEYGPGLRTLRVPFGWPPMEEWQRLGFPPARMLDWLLFGGLLDKDRAPVISLFWLFSVAILLAGLRRRACRVALVAAGTALLLALSGRALGHLGGLGALLLSFLQPLRVLPMVPITAAGCVVVAITELQATVESLASPRPWASASAGGLGGVLLALLTALALPARFRWVAERLTEETVPAAGEKCGSARPDVQISTALPWLTGLTRGRVEFYAPPGVQPCAFTRGTILASPLPLAHGGGVGAHVGVNSVAFEQLRPTQPGSARRAERLGIRYLVHTLDQTPAPEDGWIERHRGGGVILSEREGGTDLVGVGCISRVWRGPDAALREALVRDLRGDTSALDRPTLTQIEAAPGALAESEVALGACSTEGAAVVERRREPGAYEATIEALAPVDVVIRASAFPSWRVWVDGVEAPVRQVAPGFPSVRVPPGRHRIEAVVSLPRGYLLGGWLGLLVIGLACRRKPFAWRQGAGDGKAAREGALCSALQPTLRWPSSSRLVGPCSRWRCPLFCMNCRPHG